jgi:hypothetical protein
MYDNKQSSVEVRASAPTPVTIIRRARHRWSSSAFSSLVVLLLAPKVGAIKQSPVVVLSVHLPAITGLAFVEVETMKNEQIVDRSRKVGGEGSIIRHPCLSRAPLEEKNHKTKESIGTDKTHGEKINKTITQDRVVVADDWTTAAP